VTAPRVVDLHLHDAVCVRLIDPSDDDVASVERDVGLSLGNGGRAPDILVTYVDRLAVGPLTLLGLDAAACSQGYVTLPGGGRRGRSLVPLQQLGGRCEIACEREANGVPLLIDIVNLTAAHSGFVALHGAAFRLHELGWVLAGWSKGGKTETLLGVTGRGATVVGDEWVYLRPGQVFGSAHRLRLWDWQLREAPHVQSRLSAKQRRRLAVAGALADRHAQAGPRWRRTLPYKLLTELMPTVRDQQGVYVAPSDVFEPAQLTPTSTVDRLLLVESVVDSRIEVQPVAPERVAERMAVSLQYERADLLDAWARYRFVFPDASNPRLDGIGELELRLLKEAFRGVPSFRVEHPYPVPLSELADAVDALA
jgi:hypothetical protein